MASVIRHRVPKLMPFQKEAATWEAQNEGLSTLLVASAAYGTGKSLAGAAASARWMLQVPGGVSIITAPISRTLDTTLPVLLQRFIPSDFIRQRRKPHGNLEWLLQNGRTVVFWSGKGYIDSVDADHIWVDEFHDTLYLNDARWDRLMGRFRGKAKRKLLVCSGIAVEDETLERRFYSKDEDPQYHLLFPGLKASWAWENDRDHCMRAVADKPAPLKEAMLEGGRVPPLQSALPHLSLVVGGNVVDWDVEDYWEGNKQVYLSLDPGEQYGVFVCAKHRHEGIDRVVGLASYCWDRMSTSEVLERLANTTDFKFAKVFIDTDSVRDTRVLVRQHLPNTPVEDLKKGGKDWRLQSKQDHFSWAVQAGDGVRRFLMHERMLKEGKRSLQYLLRRVEKAPSGLWTKPNDEHVRDAAVYATCILLPKRPQRENKGATLGQ
jgi:hypothetical protein